MKFLVLYTAPTSASEQMAKATPEHAKAGMDAWMKWAQRAGHAIVELGAPLDNGRTIDQNSIGTSASKVVGYSILQAGSLDDVTALLQEHPHIRMPSFSIEVFESLPIPGEAEKPSQAA